MTTQNNEEKKNSWSLKKVGLTVLGVTVLTAAGVAVAYVCSPTARKKINPVLSKFGLKKAEVTGKAVNAVTNVSNPAKFNRTYRDTAGTIVRTVDKVVNNK